MAISPTSPSRRQRKVTEYGTQLQEKQKTKRAYGLREAQFKRYFALSSKDRASTGITLLQTLERRLDNVLFRAGLVTSRAHARQLINHRHIVLNGKRIKIPSTLVKINDVITAHSPSMLQLRSDIKPAEWLKVDKKTLRLTVERLPSENDLPVEFDTQKVVEFYSR